MFVTHRLARDDVSTSVIVDCGSYSCAVLKAFVS